MLAFLLSDSQPLGEIAHYAWRREYQSRGLQHFHTMLWVKDAPIIGNANEEDIAQFITTYITCHVPDKNNFPTLHQRVTKYQAHTHNAYCLRTKKSKSGRSTRVCRFGFGRKVTEELILHGVARSIQGRRKLNKTRLYDLPRNESETNINDYNPAVLLAWCGNMDIQFIGEKSSSLTNYITKYTTKSEKSSTDDIGEILQNKSAASNLWSIAMRALNNRECGALEAADTLLQLSLFGTDSKTVIRWVDVSMKRARKVKSKAELDKMQGDSEDIFCPNWVDVHYPNRPEQLVNICLYDFLRWYDIVKSKPKDSVIHYRYGDKYLRKRKDPYLINHFRFNVRKEPENYYHSLLLLFLPWIVLEDLKCGMDTYENAFLLCNEDLIHLMQYHDKLQEIERAREDLRMELDMLMAAEENEDDTNDDDDAIVGFDMALENELNDMNALVQNLNDVPLQDQIDQLNTDQKRVFVDVIACITSYCKDLEEASKSTTLENPRAAPKNILRKFVSGVGGTGKSHLINVIRRYVPDHHAKAVIVAAPTGIAAFNVNGLTLHRLLQLPIEHEGDVKYTHLSNDKLQSLRNDLKDCVLLIIDEISMVSNVTLAFINQRLCEIFNTSEVEDGWFGRLNILLFGDLLQLQPVNGLPVFDDIPREKFSKYFDSFATINLWKELLSYDELTENVRQRSDVEYGVALSEIRLGIVSETNERLLRNREISLNANTFEECLNELSAYISKLPSSNICLLSTREQCAALNTAMLSRITGPKILLKAHDQVEARTSRQREAARKLLKEWSDKNKSALTAGLEEVVGIKLGAKVMLLRNIEVSSGLVNGSIGTVKKIHRSIISDRPIEKLTILFDCGEREIEPIQIIIPLTNGAKIIRTQFPIILAYAITIHKSQGLTVSSCVVDIGKSIFSKGQSYVALSRVKSLEGLHILNFNPRSIEANKDAIVEYNRLRQCYRPQLGSINHHSAVNRFTEDKNVYLKRLSLGIIVPTEQAKTSNAKKNQAVVINRLRGFVNPNHACYANSTVQCLLNIKSIENSILNGRDSTLKRVVIDYNNPNIRGSLNLSNLRLKYYNNLSEQQDASEFLCYLFQDNETSFLRNLCSFDRTITVKCPVCLTETPIIERDVVWSLCLPDQQPGDVCTMQELLNHNYHRNDWNNIEDSLCETCFSRKMTKSSLQNFNQVIIFVLQLIRPDGSKMTGFKLRDVARNQIEIENKRYVLSGAVFHHGLSFKSGHYSAILRDDNNLFEANDHIIRKARWPNNSKDIYVLYYSRMN